MTPSLKADPYLLLPERLGLPRLGFGAAPIGNLYRALAEDAATAGVTRALELGINYFDTAPHYGFGLSESRLGRVFADLPAGARPRISSKVGRLLVPTESAEGTRHGFAGAPPLEPVFDYSYDGIMRSFEASLGRLGVETIDILFAHDLGALTHGADHPQKFREFMDGGYRALHDLRNAGQIAAIGLGVNEWEVCEDALAHGDFDCFLLAGRYTLLEQTACESFLPLCARRGVSVILGGPFNSGILASGVKGSGPFHYNYEPAPAAVIERVAHLENICTEFDVPLAAAALQFPLAHAQVCTVIAGLATATEVEQAMTLVTRDIPAAFWQCLRDQQLIHPAAPVPTCKPTN